MNQFKYVLLFVLFPMSCCLAQNDTDNADKKYQLRATAELGFLGVFDHKIQFGQQGTYFDFRKEGGQENLFAIARLSLEMDLGKRNTLIFLYQPLEINTQVETLRDIQIDDAFFPAGINLKMSYGFPFYRLSYLRHLKFKGDRFGLALGAGVQIRNATIKFESGDGTLLQSSRDVGIVPLLKLRAHFKQNDNMTLELEADGMYAPISYLNGSNTDVLGSILDASLRQRFHLTDQASTFLNLRYIGGGAQGTSNDTNDVSDGYTKNWLHFFTVSAGFTYQF